MAAFTKFVSKSLPFRHTNVCLILNKLRTGPQTELQEKSSAGLLLIKPTLQCQRNVHTTATNNSFFSYLPADHLWKSTVSVSNAGRKKGRGRGIGKKVVKNLNRGQALGKGSINMVWPGLNSIILSGKEIVYQKELPPNPERMQKMLAIRTQMTDFNPLLLDALERGYRSVSWPGRSCGPPEPNRDGNFEGFDTIILEIRSRGYMTSDFGRRRKIQVLLVTGNKKGLVGYAYCKGIELNAVIKKAKCLASRRLVFVERYEDHTVMHDFQTRVRSLELFVEKQPKGFGLRCNRYVKTICELAGITDARIKLEGTTRPLNITQAFFNGLQKQKTPQQLANLMRLNLVEFRPECDNFPRLIAAPTNGCRKREEIPEDEITNYNEVINEGRLFNSSNIQNPKKKNYKMNQNQNAQMYRLRAKTGARKSFYHLAEEKRLKGKLIAEATE